MKLNIEQLYKYEFVEMKKLSFFSYQNDSEIKKKRNKT